MNAKNPWPLAALISCLLACGGAGPQGPTGPDGAPGAPGTNGSNGTPGASGGGLVWKDSTGAFAAYDSDLGPLYVDEAQGVSWVLDSQTALPTTSRLDLFYASNNCSGTAYVIPVPAGVVFRAQGDAMLHVQPSTLVGTQVSALSTFPGSCTGAGFDVLMIPIASTIPATPLVVPTLPFSAPLHLAKP